MQVRHFLRMRLAFDKANVPADGRVAIIDPVVEATLAGQVTITSDMTQPAVEIITGRGQRLLPWNLFGWQFVSSNRLYRGSFNDGTTSLADGVANLFMCVADDNCKPIMGAWRRMPKSENARNKDRARDEFVTRCRYGFGLQREDTLGAVITSAENFVPDTTTV